MGDPVFNGPPNKPWRVTAYRTIRARDLPSYVVGHYRWYWQANIASFIHHHLFGVNVNIWKRNEE